MNHMKSDDLISRSALQKVFEAECVGECGCCKHIKHNPEGCALIENAPAVDAEPVRQWISVKDRLPECAMKCLVMSKAGTVFTTQYNPEIHRFPPHFAKSNVTHWMLLPERRRKVNNAGN